MPPSRRRVGVVALLVVGVALGGCGATTAKAQPATPRGANPVVWVGVFCSGFAAVVAAEAQAATTSPTPEGQKDGLLKLADTSQQALANAAHKLTQLGPPAIIDGTRAQDTMVGFFTTAAAVVDDRRAKLATLDAHDPDFGHKAQQLTGPDLGAAATQMRELTRNKELAPAFGAAPECQRPAR